MSDQSGPKVTLIHFKNSVWIGSKQTKKGKEENYVNETTNSSPKTRVSRLFELFIHVQSSRLRSAHQARAASITPKRGYYQDSHWECIDAISIRKHRAK